MSFPVTSLNTLVPPNFVVVPFSTRRSRKTIRRKPDKGNQTQNLGNSSIKLQVAVVANPSLTKKIKGLYI
jgi:hypothetical protein